MPVVASTDTGVGGEQKPEGTQARSWPVAVRRIAGQLAVPPRSQLGVARSPERH